MTTREHVYAIKNIIAGGPAPDDFKFSNRLIAHFLQVTRALLIVQKANKYVPISQQSYQSWCVDLEKGSYHNCCDTPSSTCQLLKSTVEIPKFLNTRFGDLGKVTDLNGVPISKTSPTLQRFSKYSITNKDPKVGYFIHDNYLYIVANSSLKKVLFNNVFLDPSTIETMNCPAGDGLCPTPLDAEFPIDADLLAPLYELTLKYLGASNVQDYENDGRSPDGIPQ